MPRRRSRGGETVPAGYRRAVEQTPDGDSSEDEGQGSDETAGGVSDLLSDQTGGVSQQVLAGSRANLNIAPSVNPGFIDTEVVNRMGLVLSLGLEYDPARGQWVPSVVDKSERAAVEQSLATDGATDDLTGPVDPGDGTTVDENGDLGLEDEADRQKTIDGGSTSQIQTTETTGFFFNTLDNPGPFTVTLADSPAPPTQWALYLIDGDEYVTTGQVSGDRVTVSASMTKQTQYLLEFDAGGAEYTSIQTPVDGFPIPFDGKEIYFGNPGSGADSGNLYVIEAAGSAGGATSGSATTSFDNPCRTTATKSAQYNVCSRSSDVTVDLWHREPHGPDSTLLARDIDEREDLSDIPNSYGNLQYELTLRRAPDGSSPKVERLGHQYIK